MPCWTCASASSVAGLRRFRRADVRRCPPGTDDDDSGDGSDADPEPEADPNDPDGDYDGDGKTTGEEAHEASNKWLAGEITDAEYYRIIYKFFCDSGDTSYCGK
ncbi:hypothetical protein [Candidatus Poriferisodalis sp.]|uniref:hypothetical protein n=1 Tax=Candidatus Poriferisodalis sp. TaxID=3101277 RepID=UPI003B59825B